MDDPGVSYHEAKPLVEPDGAGKRVRVHVGRRGVEPIGFRRRQRRGEQRGRDATLAYSVFGSANSSARSSSPMMSSSASATPIAAYRSAHATQRLFSPAGRPRQRVYWLVRSSELTESNSHPQAASPVDAAVAWSAATSRKIDDAAVAPHMVSAASTIAAPV